MAIKPYPIPHPDKHYIKLVNDQILRLLQTAHFGYIATPVALNMNDQAHPVVFVPPRSVKCFMTEEELLAESSGWKFAIESDGLERYSPAWSTTDERKRDFIRRAGNLGEDLRRIYERCGVEDYEGEDGHTYVRKRAPAPPTPPRELEKDEATW